MNRTRFRATACLLLLPALNAALPLAVFRAALPFFLINVIAVLVITFVPAISAGIAECLPG